jgi:hypothetical protein
MTSLSLSSSDRASCPELQHLECPSSPTPKRGVVMASAMVVVVVVIMMMMVVVVVVAVAGGGGDGR